MANWALFAGIYATIIQPVMNQMQGMIGGVCSAMQPVALAMVTVWLGFVGFDIANGTKTVQAAMKDFFIAGMVIGALQAGQYGQYISTFFLQAVPNTVGAALGGDTSPVAVLDTVLNNSVTSAFKVYEALPSYSLKTIPLAIFDLVFLVIDLAAVGYTFAVYMISAIVNVAAILIGPVFLALGVLPFARRFTSGWLAVLVGGCTTQLLVLAVIQLVSRSEITMIQQVVVTGAASGSNDIAMIWGLAQCALLMVLCCAVVMRIPDIAHAIAGGVYHGSQGAHSSTFGLATMAGAAAVGGARGAAGAVGTNAARQIGAGAAARATIPAGRSLSGGTP
jgi:type IV secretory pathway VirB6-like protein